ncbi:MAG: acyl-CoA dehydrogenase family protein [Hydrogenophaga sp.]|jgi:hypothetical protein|uniref:acyl-CoA dehydrogenase family protein n=1 Tax=Hydrogenophaga sp. TaxID=1904254 RepID=UPI002719CEA7|nr:acyl-CoA dehydrogenase family protein [Hydrogenophaga sp.]MDO9571910.1 acyl-CoA dehydrogenase family protein [Hydrogenophaga sp.]MDP3375782.1 acyl-CoA dehydrogenase family protein [Hydrogenophaga sp.]MDP3921848.1 acyl-CoA dehydrogenase family protein [Hydrogenophaga sp.]
MAIDQETFNIVQSTVHRFVMDRLVPSEDQVEETDEVPADNRSRYESCWVVWVLRHSVWNLTNKVERFYREVRWLRLYKGTRQIQQRLIGRQLMKD